MAKLTTSEIIDAIKEMKILEVKELVDAMKEEFGVDPSAVAVAAAPAAGDAAGADSATKTVVLKDCGAAKIAVIKDYAAIPSMEGLLTMFAGGLIEHVKNLSIALNLYAEQLGDEN